MFKFANTTTSVRFNDKVVRIAQDDCWDADDPFVKARPELFSDAPTRVYGAAGAVVMAPVETASARPGGRRRAG